MIYGGTAPKSCICILQCNAVMDAMQLLIGCWAWNFFVIQDALKDLLGGTIKEMMEAEMDDHLGYEKSERSDNDDYRNGYKRKQVNSRYGSMEIEVPQDRKSTFEPQVVKKRQKDISDIDQKIISMYAKGMTTRQISETIEDIYGFETSESFISTKELPPTFPQPVSLSGIKFTTPTGLR